MARVPLNHSTNGWYLFLNSSGTRSKTDESTIRCRTVKTKIFWEGKRNRGSNSRWGQVLTSSGQAEWKVSSGTNNNYSFHLAPSAVVQLYMVAAGDDGKSRDASATYGRLLHPITSSNYFFCAESPTTSSGQIFYYFDSGWNRRTFFVGLEHFWNLDVSNNHLQFKMSARQTPNEFLKQIIGRPVVVKLNNGVDYRGKHCQTHGWIFRVN